MSEKHHHASHEKEHASHEQHERSQEAEKAVAEKAQNAVHEHAEKIDEIRSEAFERAAPSDELIAEHQKRDEPPAQVGVINRDLKDLKYARTLKSVQKELPAAERAFSKLIHNNVVDVVSTGAEKTVARPSGLLAGSIFAFLGSSGFLWISKHYGYEYNFLLFALFFLGGFFLGLFLELCLRLVKKR